MNTDLENNEIKMPDVSRLIISGAPHYHSPDEIRGIMFMVILALLPACLAGIWHFGIRALWIMLLTVASAVSWEVLANKVMKQRLSVGDGTAILTGLLLAMNLPPTVPEWVCVLGAFIAIVLGKMVYGGMGYNPFNPALVGRVALLLGLPSIMTRFVPPMHSMWDWCSAANTVTQATPLVLTHATPHTRAEIVVDYMDLFIGHCSGCIGETCFIALLVGGIFLICLNLIRWQVPVCYIGTVFIITAIAHRVSPSDYATPLSHVLSGGLALGAFFMATDMVTTPLSRAGSVVFAVGCGIITSVIRLWGSYPEGVSFSILIMNALTPLIDKATAGHPFGTVRTAAQEVGK
ncbi:MAG: RnfABCDGE type electron transport complex subunit D [Victivallales bacterium]|nr:RnfABCDGE type electron transport complex subunit D [Victivallales bacterium]